MISLLICIFNNFPCLVALHGRPKSKEAGHALNALYVGTPLDIGMGGEHAPAVPSMDGVSFNLPRRGRGNFFEFTSRLTLLVAGSWLPLLVAGGGVV